MAVLDCEVRLGQGSGGPSTAVLAERGWGPVDLGVDTANLTNAVALYEGIGMTTAWSADIWQRPAG